MPRLPADERDRLYTNSTPEVLDYSATVCSWIMARDRGLGRQPSDGMVEGFYKARKSPSSQSLARSSSLSVDSAKLLRSAEAAPIPVRPSGPSHAGGA